MQDIQDGSAGSGFNPVGEYAEIADLFKTEVGDMADDTFNEVVTGETDRFSFVKIFVVKPEGYGCSIESGYSGFGEDGAFRVTADITDSERQRIEFSADVDIPDIALVEHIEEGVESGKEF